MCMFTSGGALYLHQRMDLNLFQQQQQQQNLQCYLAKHKHQKIVWSL